MSTTSQSARIDAQRRDTTNRQGRAADPEVSAWVSANAGTGKTHVLTNRVLRLLLAGTPPERLLCLTYTKAAAAEMSSRVFERLAGWVTIDDEALDKALRQLLGRAASPDEAGRARDLFTSAIETPGGLKVQTIHAFCERLLQRFPLEAGVPPGFQILDDEMKAALVSEAMLATLREATSRPEEPLGRALSEVVAWAYDDGFADVLNQTLARRDWIETVRRLEFGRASGVEAAAALYRRAFGLAAGDTRAATETAMTAVLSDAMLQQARDVLRGGTKTDAERAAELSEALAAVSPAQRIEALTGFFLTGRGEPRKSLMTAKLKKEFDALDASLASAQAKFAELADRRGRLAVTDATIAILRLTDAVMQRFHALKQARAALDFDDLIRAAGNLLRHGEDAQWVLYKLDGGLDHILVDEAQDTSPTQWRVIEALAREFFSGEGARETGTGGPRTVFAVGDEKQSIYGFQGAAPKMFADMGRRFESMAQQIGLAFERVPLTLSFRTVAPILESVDAIFDDPGRAQGLTSSGEFQSHVVDRLGMGGLVEIWDTEKPDDSDPAPAWAPLEETATFSPVSRLADRIATTIADWIAKGERLVSENRPVNAGDILILVRKRRPFADQMVAALKVRGIAVAGADRLTLTDQLAVKDVMGLCDFLLLPEDDLSLAAALKSPMFGLDDDDLLRFATGRRGSLWSSMLALAREDGASALIVQAVELLRRWRTRADVVPPYEFLVEVLTHGGMRQRLLARLGPEAADPLDELMGLALTYDDQEPPSLQGFMAWLRCSERDIKRDMEHGRNEVRVMTVHGSKGLEAPIVFLPDTCAAPFANRPGGLLAFPALPRPDDAVEPFIWPTKGSSGLEPVRTARDEAQQREAEEHNRLLYVALTRARDRLYVAGFEGLKGRAKGCWYDVIVDGLSGSLRDGTDIGGNAVKRIELPQTADPKSTEQATSATVEALDLPDWARRPAPREASLSFPLAPSRLAPLETDAEGDPVEPRPPPTSGLEAEPPPAPSPRILSDGNRFLRGIITHALLQYLPSLPAGQWETAARSFVEVRGHDLRAGVRRSIIGETLAVLRHPDFAPVFGPGSRAEVPVAAALSHPDGVSPPLRLAGQIDRLLASDHEVLIVDFKTNRPPPLEASRVPDAYVLQLAAYRLAVQQAFGGLPVRAALLWTDGPNLMELPSDRLDMAAASLFKDHRTSLDAR